MSTSQRTFEQVKNILGKLDNNIDAARARRLQSRMPSTPTPMPMPTPAPAAAPMQMASNPAPAPQPIPSASPSMIGQSNGAAPSRSIYGRAQPLRPDQRGNNARQ